MIQNETFRAEKMQHSNYYCISNINNTMVGVWENDRIDGFNAYCKLTINDLIALSDICAKIQAYEAEHNITNH